MLSLLSRENLRALPGPADIVHTRQLVCHILRTGMCSVLDEVGQLGAHKLSLYCGSFQLLRLFFEFVVYFRNLCTSCDLLY